MNPANDLAPAACIVCGRSIQSEPQPDGGFSYLAGAEPMGAMACAGKCTRTAIDRWKETGRVDCPDR